MSNPNISKSFFKYTFLIFAFFVCLGNKKVFAQEDENPKMQLKKISKDKKYGFDKTNPIKVGSVRNEYLYLAELVDGKGEEFTIKREGSCCSFSTNSPRAFMGGGLLDVWTITYKNGDKKITLYLNGYDFEEPKAPKGFKFKKK